MEISKVTFNGRTLIDLSNDTVTKSTLVSPETAHSASGDVITGDLDLNLRTGFYVDENGYLYLMFKGE